MARLDRLPAAKQVAQIGAVIGREFSYILLIAAAGLSEAQLTRGLDELVAAGLVFRRGLAPEAVYTFKHALVQEIAYESLLKRRRQQAHRQIAEIVQNQLREWANAKPEIVAYHFTQAGLSVPAVEWWSEAGKLAMQRSAFAEAITHLEKALQLADEIGEAPDQRRLRLRLQITYGNALKFARGFAVAEVQAAFAVARDLAAAIEDVSERFPAYYGLWSGSFVRGDLTSMQEVARAFLRDAESQPASPGAAIAYPIFGVTRWFEGNFVEARRHLEQALKIHYTMRDRELVFRFGHDGTTLDMVRLALVLWPLGVLDRAGLLIEEAVIHALEIRHTSTIAYAYAYAAIFEIMRGDRQRTAPYVQALLGLAHEHGMPLWLACGTFYEGWVQWGTVDREAGLTKMHDGTTLMQSQQMEIFMPLLMALLADIEAEAGRPDSALATLDTQLTTIERTGQRWCLAEIHRVRGEILRRCQPRKTAEAESAFMHAVDIAQSQAAKLFELKASEGLARLWRDQGKRDEARDLLGPIYNWFTEGFDAPDLKDAKALLDELT